VVAELSAQMALSLLAKEIALFSLQSGSII